MVNRHLLSRQELAELLNVGYLKIHYLTKNGKIPFLKIGRDYRYDFDEVMKSLRANEPQKREEVCL